MFRLFRLDPTQVLERPRYKLRHLGVVFFARKAIIMMMPITASNPKHDPDIWWKSGRYPVGFWAPQNEKDLFINSSTTLYHSLFSFL